MWVNLHHEKDCYACMCIYRQPLNFLTVLYDTLMEQVLAVSTLFDIHIQTFTRDLLVTHLKSPQTERRVMTQQQQIWGRKLQCSLVSVRCSHFSVMTRWLDWTTNSSAALSSIYSKTISFQSIIICWDVLCSFDPEVWFMYPPRKDKNRIQ